MLHGQMLDYPCSFTCTEGRMSRSSIQYSVESAGMQCILFVACQLKMGLACYADLHLAFVATLAGSVVALRSEDHATTSSGQSCALQQAWHTKLPGNCPVLAGPAFDATSQTLVVAAVNGSVTASSPTGVLRSSS